ncbi:hypothetical protein, partial [Streptomyces sp. SID12501]
SPGATDPRLDGAGLRMDGFTAAESTDFAMNLVAHTRDAALRLHLDYRADVCDGRLARSLSQRVLRVLETLTTHGDQPVGRLDTLDATDRERVLVQWNGNDTPLTDIPLHDLFATQAVRTPDTIAVTDENGNSLTYRELDGRANQVARHL